MNLKIKSTAIQLNVCRGDSVMEINVKYKHYRYPNEILEMSTCGVNREAAENQAYLELGCWYDIIEIEDKIGKVDEIRLRTTRAITIDDKVLIIPNHKFLTNSLFNWTQNGIQTTEGVEVGVAYGSYLELVKDILIDVASAHPKVLKSTVPKVLFTDFGESSLQFKLLFVINNSYEHLTVKSDLRFAIDKKFRENKIVIPFPQRDIHLIKQEK